MFVSENENNDVKMIFPSKITNDITVARSLLILTITYFFKFVQPYAVNEITIQKSIPKESQSMFQLLFIILLL